MRTLTALLLLLGASPLGGAPISPEIGDYVRVLVPLVFEAPRPGAYGTMWRTAFAAVNAGSEPVLIYQGNPVGECRVLCEPPQRHEPQSRFVPDTTLTTPDNPAAVLFIERSGADDVHLSLRLEEVSTQEMVALPIVREHEFRAGRTILPDVPISVSRRFALRLYDPFNRIDSVARVTATDVTTNVTLAEWTMPLRQSPQLQPDPGQFAGAPAYAELHDIRSKLPEGFVGTIVVDVRMTDDRPMWVLGSLTDDVTQDVTLVVPQ